MSVTSSITYKHGQTLSGDEYESVHIEISIMLTDERNDSSGGFIERLIVTLNEEVGKIHTKIRGEAP